MCKSLLNKLNISIKSRVLSIGDVSTNDIDNDLENIDWDNTELSEVRSSSMEDEFKKAILTSKRNKTTIGGIFQVVAFNSPVGLGNFSQWDRKLDGKIAQGMMSINAVKGVEIGSGFANTRKPGSEVQDIIVPDKNDRRNFTHITNHAGGLEGGVTNGEPIVVNVAIKPMATLAKPHLLLI